MPSVLREDAISEMYGIIHSNMAGTPTSDISQDSSYWPWRNALTQQEHVLYYRHERLLAYLSYVVPQDADELYVCELQVHERAQGDGVTLRRLFLLFVDAITGTDVRFIRTGVNRANFRSQRLHERLGFEAQQITDRGIRYRISRERFLDAVSSWR